MATSNFIDTATIWLHAGKGGDGAVTFHREKFVAAGGPDGGDGGRGGDIIFVADDNLSTLMDFRYKRKYTAPDGENGRAKRMSGADGDDLVIRVPRGTVEADKYVPQICPSGNFKYYRFLIQDLCSYANLYYRNNRVKTIFNQGKQLCNTNF